MAEIWGAAIAAVGAIAGGVAASKKAKEDRKAGTKDEALYSGILSQFEAEQEDHYNQKNRQRKERGLDQFRAYNTVGAFNPNRIEVPNKPSIVNTLEQSIVEQEQAARNKSGGGIFTKLDDAENKFRRHLDPIGAKISRKDPVRKALKKLF